MRIEQRWVIALALLSLAGCDDRRGARDGGPGVDAETIDRDAATARDAATIDRDATTIDRDAMAIDGDAGRDGGSVTPLAICQLGCTVTSDCSTPSAAFDEDNYRCEGGVCRYVGCVSDAECRSTFASDRYVCRDPGTGVRSCVIGCTIASDCTTGSAAFDADNYRCSSGACVYEGCLNDAECTSSFGAGYGCREVEPPSTPVPIPVARRNCVRLCTTATDCSTGSPAFDGDNYECRSGACVYTGCRDDAECRSSLSSDAYVCR